VTPDAIPRPAARVLLLDPDGRVLLLRFVMPDTGFAWWATPGGGLDARETPDQAARREVFEETGLRDFELGPCVWIREHVFHWRGEHWRQQERIYLARVEAFELSLEGLLEHEVEMMREHRWWSAAEIEASAERFAPRRLGQLLAELLRDGPPAKPLDVGL